MKDLQIKPWLHGVFGKVYTKSKSEITRYCIIINYADSYPVPQYRILWKT